MAMSLLHFKASALYIALNYGGGYTTTATTISFNYTGGSDNTSIYYYGNMVGRVYLVSGVTEYHIADFYHVASNSCASTTTLLGPALITNTPNDVLSASGTPCAASRNITITVPASCVPAPAGTYDVRLDLETLAPCWTFATYSAALDITIGSTTFPQTITGGFPYSTISGPTLGSAVIGTFTTTGGSYGASVTGNTGTCSSSGSLGFSITPGTGPYSIWYTTNTSPDLTTSSTSPSINVAAGTYTVSVTDANGCRRDAVTTVNPPVQPTVTATKSPAQPAGGYCKSTCITLNATPSTGTGYTYQWKRNGTNVSTNQSFCNIPGSSPTTTTYSVTISNSFGCTASGTVTALTNTSCTSAVDICCLGGPRGRMTQTADSTFTTIQLYPNPATDVVNIQFGEPVAYGTILEFTDITGKVVRHVEVPEGAVCYTMDVNDLPAGIYLANVFDQETKIISTEFVIE